MRYLLTIVGLLAVIGGLAAIKGGQIGQLIAFGQAAQAAGPPPETVMSSRADTKALEQTLTAIGTVTSSQGVEIAGEVPGVVTKINFDSGDTVRKGDVLVQLDTRVEKAQLAQAQARRRLASTSLRRTQSLIPTGAVAESSLDADASSFDTAAAEVTALKAQLAKKTIRAPFSGRLGLRQVDLGQYVNPGQALTVLESTDAVDVDFSLPQQDLPRLRVGMPVRVTLQADPPVTLQGELGAVSPEVEVATRTVRLRAQVSDADDRLRPGMFVEVEVVLGESVDHVMVPVTAIAHASYGDSVFLVEDKPEDAPGVRTTEDGLAVRVARQQFVKLGPARGDFVAIDDGVVAGEEIVVGGVFKLRNGSPIVINNDVDLEASLDPRVENR